MDWLEYQKKHGKVIQERMGLLLALWGKADDYTVEDLRRAERIAKNDAVFEMFAAVTR